MFPAFADLSRASIHRGELHSVGESSQGPRSAAPLSTVKHQGHPVSLRQWPSSPILSESNGPVRFLTTTPNPI